MEHSSSDRFLPISILVAAVIVGGTVVFSTLHKSTGQADAGSGVVTAPSPAVIAAQASKIGPHDAILGDPKSPITYADYGDYQCPFCGRYFSETESAVISQYVNTGKVKMVFRDFAFLGPESLAAANAAQCANDQGKLWPYHDELYTAKGTDFAKGGGENDGFFTRALFLGFAKKLNLDMPKFTNCVDQNQDAGIVAQEKADATSLGVNATPTFYIDGTQVQGAEPFSVIQAAIEKVIASHI